MLPPGICLPPQEPRQSVTVNRSSFQSRRMGCGRIFLNKRWCLATQTLQFWPKKKAQSWMFTGRTDVETETPILWPPDVKSWLIRKDTGAGKDWGQEEKGTTEDEMVGWHYRTQWTWVWVISGSWWCTGRPGVLRFMRSQRVGHDWVTELNWTHIMEVYSE